MKTFALNFSKDKEYSTTPSDEYLRKYQYIEPNFRGLWKPNTEYNRGDVVLDSLDSKVFYIIYFGGISNNTNSPLSDSLEWDKYNPMETVQMTNFNEILLKGDISKYTEDEKYYDVINIGSNLKIEQISQDYYNTTDYWDIIIIMNNLKTYLDLPQTEDIIIDKGTKKVKEWGSLFGYDDIDYEILSNKINLNIYGRDVGITANLLNNNSSGLFDLSKNNIFKIIEDDKLYVLNKKIQQRTKISFDSSFFPLNTDDIISFRLNNIDITFVASGGETISDVITNPTGLLAILNASNIKFIDYPLETDNSTYITIPAKMSVSPRFYVSKNNNNSTSIPDAFIFTEDNQSFNTNDAKIDTLNNYISEVTDTFQAVNMDDYSNNKKYTLLYNMYIKYFEEYSKINDDLKFLKILKHEYVDEFKQAFFSKMTAIENLGN